MDAGVSAPAGLGKRDQRFGWKRWTIVALWGAYVLWSGYGTVTNGWAALFPPHFSNPYLAGLNTAAPLFALDAWGCASGFLLALMVVNPLDWLNGKRLVFSSMAFAMILGRLASGFAAGLVAYAATINPFLGFVAAPFLLLFAGFVALLLIGFAVVVVFSTFIGIPVLIANQIFSFERSLQIYRFHADGLAGRIARFVMWLRNLQLPEPGPDDSKGARFATHQEIAALHRPNDAAAMAFGHVGRPLFIKTEKHVLIMASTRSGKGVSLILPHLLRYQGSAFVLDPKGENAKATMRRRRTLNSKVHVLDPFGITGLPQARFNPLSRFTPENMEAESKALAAALFIVSDRERDHWNAAGQQLLAAIILYVYASPSIPPDQKHLPEVRRILLGTLREALDDMVLIDTADGLLRDLALSFLATPEREFGSIVSTAQRQTEILDNPYMIACLSATGPGEEVNFKAWKTGTMSVYLCLSAPKFPTFNRWLRLVLTSALDEMTDTLEPPKLPVCFMLDELATLGHLASVENAVGLAAGYGIQLVTVFQDVAQMKDLYKGRWASFIGNAGVRALFNLDDLDTAEYWSKFIGNHLVESRSHQQDIYGFSKGENISENMRPLISSDQIMMDFASGKMLVLAQGAHPIKTDRVAYFNDPSLNGLWDDPRSPAARTPSSSNWSDKFAAGDSGDSNAPPSTPAAPSGGFFAGVAQQLEGSPTPPSPAPADKGSWGDSPIPAAADNGGWGEPPSTPAEPPGGLFSRVAQQFEGASTPPSPAAPAGNQRQADRPPVPPAISPASPKPRVSLKDQYPLGGHKPKRGK